MKKKLSLLLVQTTRERELQTAISYYLIIGSSGGIDRRSASTECAEGSGNTITGLNLIWKECQ